MPVIHNQATAAAAAACLFLASSMMVNLIPLPLGRDTHGFEPFPRVNTFPKRVANSCPVAS
ncbi:hypothetical protein Hanom_Chr06g00526501 [Helianthus anomalus]